MKPKPKIASTAPPPSAFTELLVLGDGRILVHNLTPAMARILSELNPADEPMRERGCFRPESGGPECEASSPSEPFPTAS
jgi:hypothetical protein